LAGSPLVFAVLDSLANLGNWDRSAIELVHGHDLVDDSSGGGDITLVLMAVDTTVSALGCGERARGGKSKSCGELHCERIDMKSPQLHRKATLE
jgi:hypothetical protein